MAYQVIEDFRFGQDTRKMSITAPAGTLRQLTNAHITRGGEIEKAKAFLEKYTLPASGTFGMGTDYTNLYVFGSGADPGVPSGVTYQRLDHPDGSSTVDEILSVEVTDDKLYVVAKFANDDVFHYYDGSLVTDWGAGLVRPGMTNTDGIASHLATLVDADSAVSAVAVGSVITITAGTAGVPFTIATTATNVTGGTDDQTASVVTPTPSVAAVTEVLATGQITVTAGTANTSSTGSMTITGGGGGTVNDVTVNGVDILGSAVAWNTDTATTASDVVDQINAYSSSPNYTASLSGSTITITAAQSAGATPNTYVVTASLTTVTATYADMAGGVTNAISSIKIDGVEILNSTVIWTTSHSQLAADLASTIDAYTSSPNYTADNTNALLTISGAVGTGAAPNGKSIEVTTVGNVTVSGNGSTMSGGVAAVTAVAQVSEVTIGGTFEAGDQFTITINGYPYGFSSRPASRGTFVFNNEDKMYAVGGTELYISGLNQPAQWSSNDTGASFIDLSKKISGAGDAQSIGLYYDKLTIFSENGIQLWDVDPDPTLNSIFQKIRNRGTVAPRSVKEHKDDLLFLDRSGIRAIKARDSSNFGAVSEIGTAIDKDIRTYMDSITDAQISRSHAAIEPLDERYLLTVKSNVYVYSRFAESKVSAFSTYSPGRDFESMVVIKDQLYARAGDSIYLYGGDDGTSYDTSVVTVVTPFMDMEEPGTHKQATAVNFGLEGEWDVYANYNPNDPDNFTVHVGKFKRITYGDEQIPLDGHFNHVSLKLTHSKAEYARIGNIAIHYENTSRS